MRVDVYLVQSGRFASRTRAQEALRKGLVTVNGRQAAARCDFVEGRDELCVAEAAQPASRGGVKLARAFEAFPVSAAGRVCADIGASNGGFTEVLLARGASRVYAVDVGHGQLDAALAGDKRVTVMDGVNARNLTPAQFPVLPELIAVDVSFISLRLVLPALADCLAPGGEMLALVKPQFEAGRAALNKHGVVKSLSAQTQVLSEIGRLAAELGLPPAGLVPAPPASGKNAEFVYWLRPDGTADAEALSLLVPHKAQLERNRVE